MFCNLVIISTKFNNPYAQLICEFRKNLWYMQFFSKDLVNSALIPPTDQGMFEGAVSDNFDERIDQKIFHAEIVVDNAKVSAEMKAYQLIPIIANFINEDGSDNLKETIEANYKCVKEDVISLVKNETERIKSGPELAHLIKE